MFNNDHKLINDMINDIVIRHKVGQSTTLYKVFTLCTYRYDFFSLETMLKIVSEREPNNTEVLLVVLDRIMNLLVSNIRREE